MIAKKLIVCSRKVKGWDEEVKEAMRVRRDAHTRHTSSETKAGLEKCAYRETQRHASLTLHRVWEVTWPRGSEQLEIRA